jgi:hypothetical protein
MNPVLIIVLIVAWLASLTGVGRWQYTAGQTSQKVVDQVQFDGINKQLADQKTEASAILKTRNAENLALMVERDHLKTTLEKQHAANQAATDALHARYAGLGLRFQPAQAPGSGPSGGGAQGAGADSAGADGAATVELPAEIAESLRQIAYDADTLADAYRECWGYAQAVR